MSAWDELDEWVRCVWGNCSGYLELTVIRQQLVGGKPRRKVQASHFPVSEWDTGSCLQIAETADVYLGCCTVKEPPQNKRRGTYQDRFEMPGLWLDMDIGTVGHKPSADGLEHFESVEQALETLGLCGFPEPTAVVHSGGGLYPWWLFDEPLVLDPEQRKASAQELSDKWHQHVFNTARERGLKVDKLGDLPRFLRPPGTWNLKEGGRRATKLLSLQEEVRYSPNDLWTLVAEVEVGNRSWARPAARSRERAPGDNVLADALRECEWREILEPAGWSFVGYRINGGEEWMRPGKLAGEEAGSGVGWGDVFVCFSDSAGLPQGANKGLTKLRVFAWLWFQGSEAAALRDLQACVMCGEGSAPWPELAIEAAEEAIGLDLDWVKDRMSSDMRTELELVRKSQKKIVTRDEAGQTWSTLR